MPLDTFPPSPSPPPPTTLAAAVIRDDLAAAVALAATAPAGWQATRAYPRRALPSPPHVSEGSSGHPVLCLPDRVLEAEPSPSGLPLLHLASSVAMVGWLLDQGVDPLATDGTAQTADEAWENRFKAPGLLPTLPPALREAMLERWEESLKALPAAPSAAARARQAVRKLEALPLKDLKAWLHTQPKPLALGGLLPSQVLRGVFTSGKDTGERALEVWNHQPESALDQCGPDGVPERSALWWFVAAAQSDGLSRRFARACPEATQPNAWLAHLVHLEPLLARGPHPVRHWELLHGTVGRQLRRALADTAGGLWKEGALEALTPTTPGAWTAAPPGEPLPLERLLDVFVQGLGPFDNPLDGDFTASWIHLEAWTRIPGALQAPRPRVLDACLRLATHDGGFGSAERFPAAAVLEGRDPAKPLRPRPRPPLAVGTADALRHLVRTVGTLWAAGTRPSDEALAALDASSSPTAPVLLAWMRERQLTDTLAAGPAPPRRPRM